MVGVAAAAGAVRGQLGLLVDAAARATLSRVGGVEARVEPGPGVDQPTGWNATDLVAPDHLQWHEAAALLLQACRRTQDTAQKVRLGAHLILLMHGIDTHNKFIFVNFN